MTIATRSVPTEAELEILQILWQYGPSTVRFVNDKLKEKRAVGYTTTLKFLQIMAQKNLVLREESSRSHIYRPAIRQDRVQDNLVDKLISSAFSGSAMNLVLQALGNHQPASGEIEQLRRFLDEIERGEK